VLSLFCLEAQRLLDQSAEAAEEREREARLHALVGAARNVGALRLADAARRAMKEGAGLSEVRAAADEVVRLIERAVR